MSTAPTSREVAERIIFFSWDGYDTLKYRHEDSLIKSIAQALDDARKQGMEDAAVIAETQDNCCADVIAAEIRAAKDQPR